VSTANGDPASRPPAVDPPDELEWIEPAELADPVGEALIETNARYADAIRSSDGEALVAFFEPHGAIIDMDGPDALGHGGLREMADYARARFGDVTFAIEVEWTKVDGLDPDTAYATGTWRMGFVDAAGRHPGDHVRLRGRFVQTWHRGPGDAWRLYRDITLSREADA
jgi:ketosteroid isomerase-like protein